MDPSLEIAKTHSNGQRLNQEVKAPQWKLHLLPKGAMWVRCHTKDHCSHCFIPCSGNHSDHSYEFNHNFCLLTPECVFPAVTSISLHILEKPQMQHVQVWVTILPHRLALSPVSLFLLFLFPLMGHSSFQLEITLLFESHPSLFSLLHCQHMNNHWVVPILLSF